MFQLLLWSMAMKKEIPYIFDVSLLDIGLYLYLEKSRIRLGPSTQYSAFQWAYLQYFVNGMSKGSAFSKSAPYGYG